MQIPNFQETERKWSHKVYAIAHALAIARKIEFGNVGTLQRNLVEACDWGEGHLGFASTIPAREFKEGSIWMDPDTAADALAGVLPDVAESFFVELEARVDYMIGEYLAYLDALARTSIDNKFLVNKLERIEKLGYVSDANAWAIPGLYEMVAIRNVLVHNDGRWNKKAIAILHDKAGVGDVDDSKRISLGFGDLFRYRCAARTVLGELRKRCEEACT